MGLQGRELGSALTGGSALSSRKELTAEARELKGELYCLPCHDKMGVPICGACRRPIEGRVVNALGKQWHVEVSEAGVDSRWGPRLTLTLPPSPGPCGRLPELTFLLGAALPGPWTGTGQSLGPRDLGTQSMAKQAHHPPIFLSLLAF